MANPARDITYSRAGVNTPRHPPVSGNQKNIDELLTGVLRLARLPEGKTDGNLVTLKEISFAESVGEGVWTGSVLIPASAYLLDIVVQSQVLWNSETSAVLKVGDDNDDDGYFTGVNLLSGGDLVPFESVSFTKAGSVGGAYMVGTHAAGHIHSMSRLTERSITAVITKTGDSGSDGRTTVAVMYALPSTVLATKE